MSRWPAGGRPRAVCTVGATPPAGWWRRWTSNLLGVVRRDADLWAAAGGGPRAAAGGHGAGVAGDGQRGLNVEMGAADWSWREGSDRRWRRRTGRERREETGVTYQLERGGLAACSMRI
jgi:hypothetical protein